MAAGDIPTGAPIRWVGADYREVHPTSEGVVHQGDPGTFLDYEPLPDGSRWAIVSFPAVGAFACSEAQIALL